jgi:hypothetical protein
LDSREFYTTRVRDIPAGDGNIEKLFLRCIQQKEDTMPEAEKLAERQVPVVFGQEVVVGGGRDPLPPVVELIQVQL